MKRFSSIAFQLALGLTLFPVLALSASPGKTTSVHGYVIDSACTFVKNLKKPVSPECAVACAKAGSPLVILTDAGVIYWPISNATPATGQNDRLLPYAGKPVSMEGEVFEEGGSRAIVIAKITESPAHK